MGWRGVTSRGLRRARTSRTSRPTYGESRRRRRRRSPDRMPRSSRRSSPRASPSLVRGVSPRRRGRAERERGRSCSGGTRCTSRPGTPPVATIDSRVGGPSPAYAARCGRTGQRGHGTGERRWVPQRRPATKTEVELQGVQLDPSAALPAQRGYYEFEGSLTTPPCSEGVRWLVLQQRSTVSQAHSRRSRSCTRTPA